MKYLLPVIILFLNTNLIYTQTGNGSVELKYLFTLVNGESQTKKEYLYRNPAEALTDQNNNIYVIEYHGTNIKKYSKEGKYLATIGRDGSGPGEFSEISSCDILKDKIIIFGSISNITEYSTENKLLRTIPTNKYYIRKLWNYSSNKYLTLELKDDKNTENMFYVYNNKFDKQLTSFGHPSIMFDIDSPVYFNERSSINVLILNNGDVVVSKQYCDGKIYRFFHGNNWKHEVYSSNKQYKKNRILAPYNEKTDNYNNMRTFAYTGQESKRAGKVFNTIGVGLVQYDNKYILNFIVQCNDSKGGSEFGAEIYNLKCEYLGYYKIENKNIKMTNIKTKVYGVDNDNCILMSDLKGSIPQIKKFKMNINIKQ